MVCWLSLGMSKHLHRQSHNCWRTLISVNVSREQRVPQWRNTSQLKHVRGKWSSISSRPYWGSDEHRHITWYVNSIKYPMPVAWRFDSRCRLRSDEQYHGEPELYRGVGDEL